MNRFWNTISFSSIAVLLGACDGMNEPNATIEANETALSAENGQGGDGFQKRGRGYRGPPQQAIEACANLAEGAACTFESRHGGEVEGTCWNHRDVMTCRPEGQYGKGHGRFGRGHRGPPPQMIEACADSAEGAACSFEGRDGQEVAGTCMNHPRLDALACRPEGHPGKGFGRFGRGHRGPPPLGIGEPDTANDL